MSALSIPVNLPTVVAVLAAAFAYAVWGVALAVRSARPRLAARVTATMMGALSMIALALQPRWERVRPTRPVLLVTEGASAAAVDSMRRGITGERVVALGDTAWRRRALGDDRRTVSVVGSGLASYEWAGFEGRVRYRAPRVPEGLSEIVWQREIVLGRDMVVEGHVRVPDTTWIVLDGPGGSVDSMPVGPGGEGFQLRDRSRSTGRFVYRVVLRSDTGVSRDIGVEVVPPPVMSVLVLADRPRFSIRYLRDWLAERGSAVAIRMLVSRSRYRYEFVNRPAQRFETLTGRTLAGVDVVIIDAPALANLGNRETRRLRDAVERDGIGLLALVGTLPAERAGGGPALLDAFHFAALDGDLDERTVAPRWVGDLPDSVRGVPAYPWVLEPGRLARPLMWDGTGQTVAAVGLRGAGRVVVSVMAEPERWVRRGEAAVYGAYWAQLVNALTEGRRGDRWNVEQDGPVVVDRPVALTLTSDEATPRAFVRTPSGRDERLALVQDTLSARRWRGLYWPRERGWHHVRAPGDSLSFHVTGAGGWEAWDASQRMSATARRAVSGPRSRVEPDSSSQPRPVPLGWFWLLALGAACYLWAEDKLFR